jgi:hypothetical protein
MSQQQMPVEKMDYLARQDLEHELIEKIGKVEDRIEDEKERRGDWNTATKKMKKDIILIAAKLREDDAAPPREMPEEPK